MKLITKHSLILLTLVCTLFACQDDTATLGIDMMPSVDLLQRDFKTYPVRTQSYAAGDSVLARSSSCYLGRFTDPETGTTIQSDFLTQFYCADHFAFPDTVRNDSITECSMRLYISDFIGDSLSTFKISIFELDKVLDPDSNYYTNIKPELYYNKDSKPLTTKWFTMRDQSVAVEDRNSSIYANNINIKLPRELGQRIYEAYREDSTTFRNNTKWLNSGLPLSKGVYVRIENGDGAMATISDITFDMDFRYRDTGLNADTTGYIRIASTEEIVQTTRFANNNLAKLFEGENKKHTYIKSPAGIFTMAEIPADLLNYSDSINSAKFTLVRYNDSIQSSYKFAIPITLLLVRMDDYLNGFFEKYNISNSRTSYVTNFNASKNTYSFDNISRLLTACIREKKAGTATENWNKVLLIPVKATYDTNGILVRLDHDFSMTSTRLVGGENDAVDLEVIYSSFKQKTVE